MSLFLIIQKVHNRRIFEEIRLVYLGFKIFFSKNLVDVGNRFMANVKRSFVDFVDNMKVA